MPSLCTLTRPVNGQFNKAPQTHRIVLEEANKLFHYPSFLLSKKTAKSIIISFRFIAVTFIFSVDVSFIHSQATAFALLLEFQSP